MSTAQVIAFVGVAAVVILTPGPDMLLMARHTLASGRQAGWAVALGVIGGLVVHATAAAIGISALLETSARTFATVKLVGAIYLLWLGLSALRNAANGDAATWDLQLSDVSTTRRFRQGLLTNVLNPKVAILFLSVLPQFVDGSSGASVSNTLLLSALFIVLALGWVLSFVWMIDRVGTKLVTPSVRRWVESFSGIVLVGLAGRIALTS